MQIDVNGQNVQPENRWNQHSEYFPPRSRFHAPKSILKRINMNAIANAEDKKQER